ncbi:helix-turn-helix domain-containing protein [Pedobacter miscanthi]|jgi:AraC family transcriptional activator of pobA|uniref:helix-turn-helix domain-containing protein n=1 Tax=Pedobacter miscanthi TaxID=2259170 RepID=UPI0029306530|nr:helix-turn-helix domain-containing protein [Pedobacter miscanthi]
MTKGLLHVKLEKEIKDSFSINHFKDHFGVETRAHRLAYHRILLLSEGSGGIQIDDQIFQLTGREIFLMAKGQVIRLNENTKFSGFELLFGDCFWERSPSSANNCKAVLFNNAANNQQLSLNENDYQQLITLFSSLHNEFTSADYVNKLDALAAYLKIIMIKIANVNAVLTAGIDHHENKLYRNFIELVSQHYQSSHEVGDYADLMGISARKLTEIAKKCSGKGAKDLINGQLIAEAKRALQFSSKPVKEIAYQLNFSSPDQFSHFFKKNTAISPQDYRLHFVNIGV